MHFTNMSHITIQPLPGYKKVKPFVYAGFFPVSNEDYNDLKEAIEKLSLSDSVLQFEPENSPVLGYGVRIGFLGLLHMDIIRERHGAVPHDGLGRRDGLREELAGLRADVQAHHRCDPRRYGQPSVCTRQCTLR